MMPSIDTLINLLVQHKLINHVRTSECIFYYIQIPAGVALSQDEIDTYMKIFSADKFTVLASDEVGTTRSLTLQLESIIGAKKKK